MSKALGSIPNTANIMCSLFLLGHGLVSPCSFQARDDIPLEQGLWRALCHCTPNGSPFFISESAQRGTSVFWMLFPCLGKEEERGSKGEEGAGGEKCVSVRAWEMVLPNFLQLAWVPVSVTREQCSAFPPSGSALCHAHIVGVLLRLAVLNSLCNTAHSHHCENNPWTSAQSRWLQCHLT